MRNVTGSNTNPTIAPSTASRYLGIRPPAIRLAIRGPELMISGTFDHWVPVAMDGDGSEGMVQLFFDVTGMARPGQEGDEQEELFSFEADEVERVGELAHRASGKIRRGNVERSVDALVQTPAAHTPFVALTFAVDEKAFPEVWSELSALVGSNEDTRAQIYPRAWLRAPQLASA